MTFVDELAKRTKTKEQLVQEERLFLEKETIRFASNAIDGTKRCCVYEAERGKRAYDSRWAVSVIWEKFAGRPIYEKVAAKMIKEALEKEGFKSVKVRPFRHTDYDGDSSVGVRIIVKW